MKKIAKIILLFVLSLGIVACGNEQDSIQEENVKREHLGILPSRIEQIDQGGTIPDGHEAKVEGKSEYTKEMFWGTWVIKGSKTEEVQLPESTFEFFDKTYEESVEILCFPKRLSFNPAWAGVSTGYSGSGRSLAESVLREAEFNAQNKVSYLGGTDAYTEMVSEMLNVELEEEPLGMFFEENGYGFGGIELQQMIDGYSTSYDDRKIVYSLHENTLAIGITDAGLYDHLTETDVFEIDYEIVLKGCELQLTYGEETAVYVPEQIEGTENYQGYYMNKAGIVANYEEIDHIKGITLIPEEEYLKSSYGTDAIMFNFHEGYVESSFEFKEDGIVKIRSSKGNEYEYEYIYSGDALTLMSDDKTTVYSLYDYALEGQCETPTNDFNLNGEPLRLEGLTTLEKLCEKGFQTNVDLNQPIASGQVTDEIVLNCQGAKMTVKVGNPFEYAVGIGDGIVCYYCLDEASSILNKGDGTEIGVTTYDEINYLYAPYEQTESMLRYMGAGSGILMLSSVEFAYETIFDTNRNLEVIYEFENGILSRILMENPSVLYNGLQDNVDRSLLAQMEPEEFTGVMQIRNTIVDKLKAAFTDANISADVNLLTGEILMDNDILFGVDEYELSETGKQYIDSFMGVYASVITAEEFSNYISEVLFEGHTDSSGTYGYNLVLSQKRAESVLNYCMSSTTSGLDDIQKTKLQELSTAIGYSSSDPILTETGSEDMDASRRVAIKFYVKVN